MEQEKIIKFQFRNLTYNLIKKMMIEKEQQEMNNKKLIAKEHQLKSDKQSFEDLESCDTECCTTDLEKKSYGIVPKKKKSSYKDYLDIENKKLITSYGPQVYEAARVVENLCYDLKNNEVKFIQVLKNHDITPHIRTKLVDWLLEVLYAYKCNDATIYMTIHLMDAYFYKYPNSLKNNDIHLVGITALYVASKFEDIFPIDLKTIVYKISHGKFKESEVKAKEKELLKLISFKLINTYTNEFIQNFIYDFCYNNKKVLKSLNIKEEINILEETAIYLSKLILHSDLFSGFKSSIKAIACLILAFDVVRANVQTFSGEIETFVAEWIKFLVEQSRYEPEHINQLYNKVKQYYTEFDNIKNVQHNLKKNSNKSLNFI